MVEAVCCFIFLWSISWCYCLNINMLYFLFLLFCCWSFLNNFCAKGE